MKKNQKTSSNNVVDQSQSESRWAPLVLWWWRPEGDLIVEASCWDYLGLEEGLRTRLSSEVPPGFFRSRLKPLEVTLSATTIDPVRVQNLEAKVQRA